MLRFIFKSFHSSNRISEVFKFYSTSIGKAKKSISIQNGNQDSFTVDYLMNKCGFSVEKAIFASTRYVKFDKPNKPDSVICFLKNQGFTESQIRKVVAIEPRILSANCEKTLLPKIEFFRSRGASTKHLVKVFVFLPTIFHRSLKGYILPSFNFIKDFVGSEKDAILAISNCSRILLETELHVKPNIAILLGAGMSQSRVAYFMKKRPILFAIDADKLKESVKQIKELGINPELCTFGVALVILTTGRRSTWDKKIEAYKSWGCSEDDVLRSFKILPTIMSISEEHIHMVMNLFVHEIGWESSKVLKTYMMLTSSWKKRIIPRWSVLRELIARGLVKKEDIKAKMFVIREDLFLKKFVNCYKSEAPELSKLYIEKQALK